MLGPEPVSVAAPDDAEALDAARAEFWMRWRGELPSYAEARRVSAKATQADIRPVGQPPRTDLFSSLNGPRRQRAESLRVWFERRITKELDRSERRMTRDEWRAHREWIEEHARSCLWEALERHAAKGKL
ncbi:hypothetical protein [Paraburkholderia sp. DHOC27]|uniref:hypothetical protein n=1 Tax=Paraburkholderia sp. DHOC27 TaxID=2303330 RepID=UPI0011C1875A|nr:hypothetical protein [Paraburkholderia sp. DHOC27]